MTGAKTQRELAAEYGISQQLVSDVVGRHVWREVWREPMPASYDPRRATRKLTPEQVDQMRADYATGQVSQRLLAVQYGVSPMTVNRVLRGLTYHHTGE